MIPAFIFMGAGIVGQIMFISFKDAFFTSGRLKRAEAEAQKLLESNKRSTV